MTLRELSPTEPVTEDSLQRVAWSVEDNGFWPAIDSSRAPYPGPDDWAEMRDGKCLAARSDRARCDRGLFRNLPFCDLHFGNAWRAMVAVADADQREAALRIRANNRHLFAICNAIDEAAYWDARALLERSPERVYFFRSGHAVKIGRSVKVDARIKSLRGSLAPVDIDPSEGELLGTVAGGSKVEKTLHRHFARHRLAGEWFSYEPIADEVAALIAEQVAA